MKRRGESESECVGFRILKEEDEEERGRWKWHSGFTEAIERE